MIYYKYNFNLKYQIYIFLFSFLFALPAISYFLYIIIYYDFFETLTTFGGINYLSSSLIIFSIIFFYLIPFFWNDLSKVINYYKKNLTSLYVILFAFFCLFFLDINLNIFTFSDKGGGVFLKLSEFLSLNSNIVMMFSALISIFFLNYIFDKNRIRNYLILVILILSLSLNTIYQKYLDPFFIIIFFSLINSDVINEKIKKKEINLSFVYLYFLSFYLFSSFYYM